MQLPWNYRILVVLVYLGFIAKPEGALMSFKDWRWDCWNSDCRYSFWSKRQIKINPLTF